MKTPNFFPGNVACRVSSTAVILLFNLLVWIPMTVSAVDVGTPSSLTVALDNCKDGAVIRLTADITYNSGISITDKNLTLDLNGYNLNVYNTDWDEVTRGAGLYINDKELKLVGSGEFNVTGNAGVYVEGCGKATVTNATATGIGYVKMNQLTAGVVIHGKGNIFKNGPKVTVLGDVKGRTVGADVWTVRGNLDIYGSVYVTENIANTYGVFLYNESDVFGSSVQIEGGIVLAGGGGIYARVWSYVGGYKDYNQHEHDFFLGGYEWYEQSFSTVAYARVLVKYSPACRVGALTSARYFNRLTDGLLAARTGETVCPMVENINENGSVTIQRDITLCLDCYRQNGSTVGLTNPKSGQAAITVTAGGNLNLTGKGEFYAYGTKYGVYAEGGGKATVTHALATSGTAVYATGTGSEITTLGNATSTAAGYPGANAQDGGKIKIDGIIKVQPPYQSSYQYIQVGSENKKQDQNTSSPPLTGYRTYTNSDQTNVVWVKLPSDPAITTLTLPAMTVDKPYSCQLAATGAAPFTWKHYTGTLPQGLTLSSTGLLSGTPNKYAGYVFAIEAKNSKGSDIRYYSVLVGTAPEITTATLFAAIVNKTYSTQFYLSEVLGVITWSVAAGSTLPAGLTLSQDGLLSGTPTTAGTFNFSITATNQFGSTTKAFSLVVTPNVCEIVGGAGYLTVSAAITAVNAMPAGSAVTIRMTDNYNNTAGIVVNNRKITFDLNGKTLNIGSSAASARTGLTVYNKGEVHLSGTGALNVTGGREGVSADGGSKVTVTNVTTLITDEDDVYGVYAGGKSSVTVLGNIKAGCWGVRTDDESTVAVHGNIEVVGLTNGGSGSGVWAEWGSKVVVLGNITVAKNTVFPTECGVHAEKNSCVVVGGKITVPSTLRYIRIGNDYMSTVNYGNLVSCEDLPAYSRSVLKSGSFYEFIDRVGGDDSYVYVKGPVCSACRYIYGVPSSGGNYDTFDEAMDVVKGWPAKSAVLITLYDNVEYRKPIVVDNRTIDIELINNTLDVRTPSTYEYALEVKNGGEFKIILDDDDWTGKLNLYGKNGMFVGSGSFVSTVGNITAENIGISANGSEIIVQGNITAGKTGVSAVFSVMPSDVSVYGNVNITAPSTSAANSGVYASRNSYVTVDGNITVTGNPSYPTECGVHVENEGNVFVRGGGGITVSDATRYVKLENNYLPITAYKILPIEPNLLRYQDNLNTVVVKAPQGTPGISGPTLMALITGYASTSTAAYTVIGSPAPTVEITSGDPKITWNNATKKLDIAAGLAAGLYPVVLTAKNGTVLNASITFMLMVTQAAAPGIIGQSSMTLTEGYAATSSDYFTIMGNPTPTVEKTSGNPAVVWNKEAEHFNIAAGLAIGTYPIVLTASNGISPNAQFTFTLTISDPNGIGDIPQIKALTAYMQNGTLHIEGLTAGQLWSMYNISGVLVHQSIATGNPETWRAASLQRGVYIIQSNNQIVKVVY